MCYITATELKKNLGHYLELSNQEDIFVTKNNKVITVLTSPRDKAFAAFLNMQGALGLCESDPSGTDELAEGIIAHAHSR